MVARRLLHDGSIDPADRVVGALAVIYAQRLSNIARLTRSDVLERDGDVFIRLGKEHVLMPEPLGTLVRELPCSARSASPENSTRPSGSSRGDRREGISTQIAYVFGSQSSA